MKQFPLTHFFYTQHGDSRETVTLVDVGCSQGVIDHHDSFGALLHAVGFDPLETEIERLRRVEQRPHVRYEAAFVGLSAGQQPERDAYEAGLPLHWRHDANVVGRSSAVRAQQLSRIDHTQVFFNAGAPVRHSSRRISLDEWAGETGASPDIVKIDTDGAEIDVLRGAEQVLRGSTLYVLVECRLNHPLNRYSANLANVDTFLRDLGFCLYSLDAHGYTRADLPGPFHYDMFAQTRTGQPDWADCMYMRDLAAPDYTRLFGFNPSSEQLIKLACIFEHAGLQDCAAELIVRHSDMIPYPAQQLLDLLVPDYLGTGLTYDEYVRAFEADPKALFTSRQRRMSMGETVVMTQSSVVDGSLAATSPGWGSAVTAQKDEVRIETSSAPWSYAATLPLPDRSADSIVALEVRVLEGTVGVSLMGPGHDELSGETWIEASDIPREVWLPLPRTSRADRVLVRNGRPEGGASKAVVRRARLLER